jgi:hypothetical protein
VTVDRPRKLHAERKGMFAEVAIISDGKILTIHGKKANVYFQMRNPGAIDDAIRAVEIETGLDMPGADLLFSDPYSILNGGVLSSSYLGTTLIGGVECHHLSFREEIVDWQLWVTTGNEPLPLKYVITSKWMTGAPQYELRLRNWNTSPRIESRLFKFSPSRGAVELERVPVNEMGEFIKEKQR